jgi:hypothetical protein
MDSRITSYDVLLMLGSALKLRTVFSVFLRGGRGSSKVSEAAEKCTERQVSY